MKESLESRRARGTLGDEGRVLLVSQCLGWMGKVFSGEEDGWVLTGPKWLLSSDLNGSSPV